MRNIDEDFNFASVWSREFTRKYKVIVNKRCFTVSLIDQNYRMLGTTLA